MKHLLWLGMSLLILTACGRSSTPTDDSSRFTTEETSQGISDDTSSSSVETSATETMGTSEEQANEVAATIVGTWEQANLTLMIDKDGHWQFEGEINSQGTLKVGMESGLTKMVKLYGFNENIANIGNYFIAHINEANDKMSFGYLGTFHRVGNTVDELADTTYMDVVETEGIDFSRSLLGTWTMRNKDYHYQSVWNYNPDGTFEIFSDGKGEAITGTYTVEYLDGDRIKLFIIYDGETEEHSTEYLLKDGLLIEEELEWATRIRNTDPAAP